MNLKVSCCARIFCDQKTQVAKFDRLWHHWGATGPGSITQLSIYISYCFRFTFLRDAQHAATKRRFSGAQTRALCTRTHEMGDRWSGADDGIASSKKSAPKSGVALLGMGSFVKSAGDPGLWMHRKVRAWQIQSADICSDNNSGANAFVLSEMR